jgi:hypothetical protein
MFITPPAPLLYSQRTPPAAVRYAASADLICYWKNAQGRTIDLGQMCRASGFTPSFLPPPGLKQPITPAQNSQRVNQAPSNNWSNVSNGGSSNGTPVLANPTTIKPAVPAKPSATPTAKPTANPTVPTQAPQNPG